MFKIKLSHEQLREKWENVTPEKYFEMGIYICYSCGALNPVEVFTCKKCGEIKFVIRNK